MSLSLYRKCWRVNNVDDDLKRMGYWRYHKKNTLETKDFLAFIEKYSIMCEDLEAKMWGVNFVEDEMAYRIITPKRDITRK